MIRNTLVLILMLMAFQKVSAQTEKDTILYYMKNSGELVSKDSADYAMFIMPNDAADKKSLYPVVEYYPNGKRKLTGTTHNQFYVLRLEGACMTFFPDGHRQSIANYQNGIPIGDVVKYYPNGNIYIVGKYGDKVNPFSSKLSLIECRDSTGKVLAENGNGHWLKFNEDFKNLYEEGPIKDGVEDGAWTITVDEKKLNFIYTKGVVTTSIDYGSTGKIFSNVDVYPKFQGGMDQFYGFLQRTMRYPAIDREKNITGKVLVSFIVEKDGALTDIKIVQAPSKTLGAEAMRAVQLSPPWIPGFIAGAPVRTTYTIPVNFTLARDN